MQIILCGLRQIISEKEKLAIAREFEDAVTEVLISKTRSAIEKHNPHTLIIGGGVIANHNIRKNILELENYYPDLKALVPTKDLTTDNATMIAIAGYLEKISGQSGAALRADGNLEID
jgi:N6-L-threonylcarbamoyladenine synthase